jgi:hypothetical protein
MFDPIMYAMMKKNGGGLPVVEITTEPGGPNTPLNAEENAALDAASGTGLPCIFKIVQLGISAMSFFASDGDGEGNPAHIVTMEGVGSFIVQKTASGWTFSPAG